MVKKIIAGISAIAMSLSLFNCMAFADEPTYTYTLETSTNEAYEDNGLYFQYFTVYCKDVDTTKWMASGTTNINVLTDNVSLDDSFIDSVNLQYMKKQGSKYKATDLEPVTNLAEGLIGITFGQSQAAFSTSEDGAFYEVCIASTDKEAIELKINSKESTIQLCDVTDTYGCANKESVLKPNASDETIYVLKDNKITIKGDDPEPVDPNAAEKLTGNYADGANDNAVAFKKTFDANSLAGKTLMKLTAMVDGVARVYKGDAVAIPNVDGELTLGVVIQYKDATVNVESLAIELQ